MNATIIIPAVSRARAKETFSTGEYLFNVGLSATGVIPFTHYVSSGDFLDEEVNTFARGGATSFKHLAGAQGFDRIAFEFGLHQVTDVPENYINDDKPYRVETWAAKQVMAQVSPGMATTAEAFIDAIEDIGQKESAKASWYNAKFFERDNSLIGVIQAQFSMTDEQIDAMFLAAWNLVPVF